jgi:hypothetical protein
MELHFGTAHILGLDAENQETYIKFEDTVERCTDELAENMKAQCWRCLRGGD